MNKTTLILLLILTNACSPKKNNKGITEISKSDFMKSKEITGEIVEFDDIINNYRFHVLRDSLVLIENDVPSPFYFKIINLYSGQKIVEFAERGRGPNEFLSGKFVSNSYNYNKSNKISIYDIVRKRVSEYNFDSLIENKKQNTIKHVDMPDFAMDFSKVGEDVYICFNSYFLNDDRYSNDIESVFIYSDMDKTQPDISDCKYFTYNVSGGYTFVAPEKDKIFVTYHHEDRIEIYNKKLGLLKVLVGPDMIVPKIRLKGGNHVSFKSGTDYRGYYPGCYTNNALYLIYIGLNDEEGIEDSINRPVEVFKLDWDGNLLKRYELDRYIYTISVSSDEKYLYGTTRNEAGRKLVRYAL